ncbi:MAG TPA: Hsp20/alpha crystallin family protein [Chthoniobacterales bacterium]
MARVSNVRVRLWAGHLGDFTWQHTSVTNGGTWQPAINAFRCEKFVCVCVDLSGVEKTDIDVQVEPTQLSISGRRNPPEPLEDDRKPVQVLAMEIDYGAFSRSIQLPVEVDVGQVTAEQKQGLLWIELPILKSPQIP